MHIDFPLNQFSTKFTGNWVFTGFSVAVFGAELKGVTMPDQDKIESKNLVLNGQGIREVSVLGIIVRVYVAGLYLEKKSEKENDILDFVLYRI